MIADPARSRMLAHLLGGQHASAGELAVASGVGASTASAHLSKLVSGGLVTAERRGRHRYFRIADADVAHALEALALVANRDTHDRRWSSPGLAPLRHARRCYGHLAGEVGVALLQRMLDEQWLSAEDAAFTLTPRGERWLRELGLDPQALPQRARFAYPCLDWSERRDHLAGTLGSALLDHALARRWLRARGGAGDRSLLLTPEGRRRLVPTVAAPHATARPAAATLQTRTR